MTALALARAPAALAFAKYRAVWLTAFRQRLCEPAVLAGAALQYAFLLFVFSRMWPVMLAGEPDAAARANRYLWYLTVTEWILCAQPRFHLDIENDVRLGDIAYQLLRPTSYVGFRLAFAAAELCVNLLLLAPIGLCVTTLLVGPPAEPLALLAALPLGLLASSCWLLCTAMIGLSAFWVQDTNPLYWIFQKAAFVLGGLMVPLDLYPAWLRATALSLPFSALLYLPAHGVLGSGTAGVLADGARIALWSFGAALGLRFVYRRALRVLDAHGG
jgi:ABC-2 type transport system permease protein